MVILKKQPKPRREVLHGHTTIELRDVRTGKRERFEHDNTFTGAMDEYVKTNGIWQQSPWANATWASAPIYQRLLGGVYIFRNQIPADEATHQFPHFMPADNDMVANASFGVGNASDVSEMGSYNSLESSFSANSLSFVYDWSTSQGNTGEGDGFQCVCLGNDVGAYIGYGNETSGVAHTTLKDLTENQNYTSYAMAATMDYDAFQAGTNSSFTGTSVTLTRNRDIFNQSISLFPSNYEGITITVPTDKIPAETNKYVRYIRDGVVLITPATTENSTNIQLGFYNMKDSTWTWHTIMNTTGNQITWDQTNLLEFSERGVSSTIANNKFFIRFAEEQGDSDTIITQDSNGVLFSSIPNTTPAFFEFAPYLWMTNGYLYNAKRNVITRCNGSKPTQNNYRGLNANEGDNLMLKYNNNNYCTLRQYHNPFYLATVNNLESRIQKTIQTAMKLTYTVSKIAEEELQNG